ADPAGGRVPARADAHPAAAGSGGEPVHPGAAGGAAGGVRPRPRHRHPGAGRDPGAVVAARRGSLPAAGRCRLGGRAAAPTERAGGAGVHRPGGPPMNPTAGIVAVLLVAVSTALLGIVGVRAARTTSDFYVASRTVSPWWNASAISGEYLSAASFLGVAGLILAYGADMLWFGVGYTAGYLLLLVLVAAPLRRSGAYTLPDFAELRLESQVLRKVASAGVVTIGWLYLLPQLHAAGITLRTIT